MQKPKIICPGLGRTGTSSMKEALEIIGFGPSYHFRELINNPEQVKEWKKLRDGKSISKDSIFYKFNAFMDFPAHVFYNKLSDLFDDYRVILTTRDFDDWYESNLESIYKASPGFKNKIKFTYKLTYSKRTRYLLEVLLFNRKYYWQNLYKGKFKDKEFVRSAFNRHNNKIIDKYSKNNNLLVFNVNNGWEKLCDFLNTEIPNVDFPHLNKKEDFKEYARSEIGNFLKNN